jgi:hypothetical protein
MAPRRLMHAWTVLSHFARWMKPEATVREANNLVEKFLADQGGDLLERWHAFNRSGYDLAYESGGMPSRITNSTNRSASTICATRQRTIDDGHHANRHRHHRHD